MVTKIARYAYLIIAWLLVAAVLVTVFFSGLAAVARILDWFPHIMFGLLIGLLLLIMLLAMYIARLPGRIKSLTWALFGVYLVQVAVAALFKESLPFVSAIHPVLALVDFSLAWYLARHAGELTSVSSTAYAAVD